MLPKSNSVIFKSPQLLKRPYKSSSKFSPTRSQDDQSSPKALSTDADNVDKESQDDNHTSDDRIVASIAFGQHVGDEKRNSPGEVKKAPTIKRVMKKPHKVINQHVSINWLISRLSSETNCVEKISSMLGLSFQLIAEINSFETYIYQEETPLFLRASMSL